MTRYDRIGRTYATGRRTDRRWMAAIDAALGDARTVLNVGAGTGSYEPSDRDVVALEPSEVMIGQRPRGAAPVVQGRAEQLPFADQTFDVALAILTIQHWEDARVGLEELRRVAARQVLLAYDPEGHAAFWLVRDYVPESAALDRSRVPPLALLRACLGPVTVTPLPVPRDMEDGVLSAYWSRPAAYLDPEVRANASSLAQIDDRAIDRGMAALARDLSDGTWEARNRELADLDALDTGYRIITAGVG
jgi:SAM-dependent methyltransferase